MKIIIKNLEKEEIKKGKELVKNRFRDCLTDATACAGCPFTFWFDCGALEEEGTVIKFKKNSIVLKYKRRTRA